MAGRKRVRVPSYNSRGAVAKLGELESQEDELETLKSQETREAKEGELESKRRRLQQLKSTGAALRRRGENVKTVRTAGRTAFCEMRECTGASRLFRDNKHLLPISFRFLFGCAFS